MRLKMETRAKRAANRAWLITAFTGAMVVSLSAVGQQKSGPGITDDESLTFHGITLYGVIDLGLQYETHGAPLSDFRPAASGNIVQKNSRQSVFGVTPSNEGQSRVGLQGDEPLQAGDWSAIFRVETFFNPQSGQLANSLKSITTNNGKTTANSSVDYDGSSAGQAFQTAFAGLSSKTFGTVTFGRQLTILTEGTVKYDPNQDSNAFGLIGASGTYQGGGTTEDKRLDSMLKYNAVFGDIVHVGALYKLNGSNGSSNTAVQAVIGAQYAGASVDDKRGLAPMDKMSSAGIEASREMVEWLWNNKVAAIGTDCPSVEAFPFDFADGNALHYRALPLLGLPLGELFVLAPLAEDCAKDRRYEFMVVSAPLNLEGGIASPPNAMAIK